MNLNTTLLLPLLLLGSTVYRTANAQPMRDAMSFLDNGVLKIGVNLDLGGAITYLSLSGKDRNLINSWDWGRQIQMSHYSGPVPFEKDGKKPAKHWAGLG